MVGIVIVSHSAAIAEGVAQLARQMAGEGVAIEPAGGLDEPGSPLGTDAALVQAAIEKVHSDDGVLVLMDLGSAVMSAEMALEMLSEEQRGGVLLCEAPVVEGAVAAAAAARLGEGLQRVADEARAGLRGKAAHLGAPAATSNPDDHDGDASAGSGAGPSEELLVTVTNPLGLHARPAARFVGTAGAFDAEVEVENTSTGAGPGTARSLNALATLGVRRGHEIRVTARGPQARDAITAIKKLVERGFGDTAAPDGEGVPAGGSRGRGSREGVAGDAAGASIIGLPCAPGSAVGPARHQHRPRIEVPDDPPGDPGAEQTALAAALDAARRELSEIRRDVARRGGDESAAIFDAHLLLLEDPILLEPVRRAIVEEGRAAAPAWVAAVEAVVGRYRALDDDYQRARADDVAEVGRRVLAHLVGAERAPATVDAPGILVAPELAPGDTAALDPETVRGIVTARGGPTGHAAILARSLGIPAVVGAGDGVMEIPEGTPMLVDGDSGAVHVDPDAGLVEQHETRRTEQRAQWEVARRRAKDTAETIDGRRILVGANLGSVEQVGEALDFGADGVGLLRTEFLFLDRATPPDEEEQRSAYAGIAAALQGRPLVLRTLDAGADKPVPYLRLDPEDNPFLGLRGIRLSLARPEMFVIQLRAALRAATEHPLKLMFPMVASVDELRRAKSLLEEARGALSTGPGRLPQNMEVGIMVEVPACALTAGEFAPDVDFFSIGTNDLAQYTLAAERGNRRVAGLSDALHPSVLRLIGGVVEAAEAHGKWVGVCGELAGDPGAAPILVGLGATELSMHPQSIPLVKETVRRWSYDDARALACSALEMGTAQEVRGMLSERGPSRPLT